MSAPTLPEQVPAGLRVHRDSTNTRELTEGVKLVKTRKAWDTNTIKLLLGVGPNVHTRQVFLSAALRRVEVNSNVAWLLGWVGKRHPRTLGDWKIGVHNLGACCFGEFLSLDLGMFTEKKDDYSFFCSPFTRGSNVSCRCAWRVTFLHSWCPCTHDCDGSKGAAGPWFIPGVLGSFGRLRRQ